MADLLLGGRALLFHRALAIAEPILETLQHAHEHGLVHRDVKPDNILIEAGTGRPLLVDFGIVKWLDGAAGQTQEGFIVGTPLYMSPEQALGRQDVDARADVYGIGVVLFQMLTGAPPFEGDDSQEIVTRHVHEPVPIVTLSSDRVPPWLKAVLLRCLAKHPDDRYHSARAVLDALRAGRASAGSASGREPRATEDETPTAAMPRVRRRGGRRRSLVALGLVAVVGALWASVRPQASLVVYNRLTEPIARTLDDTGFTVAAGDSLRLPARAPARRVRALVRPTSGDGRALGAEVEERGERGGAGGAGRSPRPAPAGSRFSPLVVNRTTSIAVRREPGDTLECCCAISPATPCGWATIRRPRLDPGARFRRASGKFNALLTGWTRSPAWSSSGSRPARWCRRQSDQRPSVPDRFSRAP